MAEKNEPIGVILSVERYHELLTLEINSKVTTTQQDVEKELNEVPKTDTPIKESYSKYEYDGRPYALLSESKIKVSGIFEKLFAHPKLASFMSQVPKEDLDTLGHVWLPVTIYKALYENVQGEVWVRMKEEFDSKFKPVK